MSTFNMPPGVTTNDIPGNERPCSACEYGEHGTIDGSDGCACPCHWLIDDIGETETATKETLSAAIDREQIADARADLGDWLDNAARQANDVLEQLRRALRDASKVEPVTAMVILPLLRDQATIWHRIAELVQLRRE